MKLLTNTQGKVFVVSGNALELSVPAGYQVLKGITFNNNVYFNTGIYLKGSDTLRFAFSATAACNVLGCYHATNSTNNYSLYVNSTNNAAYLRYDGSAYNSRVVFGDRYDVEITPTGSNGMLTDETWTAAEFTATNPFLIGTTSVGATSSKLQGALYGPVEVVGRGYYVPVKRTSDDVVGYYDLYSGQFLTNQGSGAPGIVE